MLGFRTWRLGPIDDFSTEKSFLISKYTFQDLCLKNERNKTCSSAISSPILKMKCFINILSYNGILKKRIRFIITNHYYFLIFTDGSATLLRPAMLTELAIHVEVVTPLILSMASKAVGIAGASNPMITWVCLEIQTKRASRPVAHSLSTNNPPPTENLTQSDSLLLLPRTEVTQTIVPIRPVSPKI